MPATRNARKKNKFEPSSSQDSRKRPHKRVEVLRPGENVCDKQVAASADDAYELSKPADAQTPISPVPVALTSEALHLTPLASPSMTPTPKPLKGRKRFSADLHELHTTCPPDLDRGTWSVQSMASTSDIQRH